MAEIRLHEGESIESALRRFKRKVMQERHYQGGQKTFLLFETGRKETRQTSISPETQPEESALRTPRRAKVVDRKTSDPRVYCFDVQKNLCWKSLVSNHRN